MFTADPPALVVPSDPAPSPSDNQLGMIEIVVSGTRPDEVLKIDRRTYQVRDNPNSTHADSLQLLRGLPTVTITPDDKIMLLGAPNVTLLVDDRPVRGDVIQYLHTVHGSDIERIEIITNPSAQYSPQGTGGIVNIVLRKDQRDGMSGATSGEASTLGDAKGSATIKYKHGPWLYELQMQGDGGRTERSSYRKLRTIQGDAHAAPTINTEHGSGASRGTGDYLSAKLTRSIDDRTRLIARAFGGAGSTRTNHEVEFRGLTPDFESFAERRRSTQSVSFGGVELSFDHKGMNETETFKAHIATFGHPELRRRFESNSGDDSFLVDRHERGRSGYAAEVDWQRPLGARQILSLGGNWLLQDREFHYRFTPLGLRNVGDDPALRPDTVDSYDARTHTLSAYATFQQTFGTWTVMPGVRLERYSQTIGSPERASSAAARTTPFPSFHLQHALSETVKLTASYSKRIDRPEADDLRPYPIVSRVDTILMGNPELRDQSTDAYEINLHYRRKDLEAGVIVYDRETRRLWANSYSVNATGQNVVTPINSGGRRNRGAEFDITTPFLERFKATASLNLFDSRLAIAPARGDITDEQFRYTLRATLEWNGAERNGQPGDIAQVHATYDSPSQSFQFRDESRYSLGISYTHSFSRTLSLTGSLDGIGSTYERRHLSAPQLEEDHEARALYPVLKIKLSKTFGNSK